MSDPIDYDNFSYATGGFDPNKTDGLRQQMVRAVTDPQFAAAIRIAFGHEFVDQMDRWQIKPVLRLAHLMDGAPARTPEETAFIESLGRFVDSRIAANLANLQIVPADRVK